MIEERETGIGKDEMLQKNNQTQKKRYALLLGSYPLGIS